VTEVIELRQYTLHPGQRDVLIELFDREFIETQEAEGMRIIGQFRNLDDPDTFVWLRGFTDMPARQAALQAFYTGPAWRAHRDAANATMIDSANVLLLRPAGIGFALDPTVRDVPASSVVVATIYSLESPVDQEFLGPFTQDVVPVLAATGASPLALLSTEYAENNFPGLPVRTGENVFVWFASFPDIEAYRKHAQLLDETGLSLPAKRERLLLSPTDRSLLR
jgi:quinol monooxygenase YgiN